MKGTDSVVWLMGARPRTRRSSREFRDLHGCKVQLGDVVEFTLGRASPRRGVVIRLERDRTRKPFVMQGIGSPSEFTVWYAHREYLERTGERVLPGDGSALAAIVYAEGRTNG